MTSRDGQSPKDLRHLLSVAKQDSSFFPDDIKENLTKLKILPGDEKSERAMLRSRIDQQSELICILKKQADSSLIESQKLQNHIKTIEIAKEEAQNKYQDHVKKYDVLDKRFAILFHNHEEIIKIKDEYKAVNDKLKRENQKLLAEMANHKAKIVEEMNLKFKKLEESLQVETEKFLKRDTSFKELKEQMMVNEKENHENVNILKARLADAEHREMESKKLATSEASLSMSARKEAEEVREQNIALTHQIVEQNQTINVQEKKIHELVVKLHDLEISITTQRENLMKEMETASINAQVRKLNTLLKAAEDKIRKHDKEFEAYKTHSEKLLLKEREINSRLRQLIG